MKSLTDVVLLSSLAVNLTIGVELVMHRVNLRRKRILLEDYLRAERLTAVNGRTGLHTLVHLVLKLGLTENEIVAASFRSKCIIRISPANGEAATKAEILFGYQAPACS